MKKKTGLLFIILLFVMLILGGCDIGGSDGDGSSVPRMDSLGRAAAVRTKTFVSNDICEYGGIQVDIGIDENGNGVLDIDEVDNTEYVCNGTDGLTSMISVTEEPVGVNCDYGGQRIDTGFDTNINGALDAEEVTETSYVCNGAVYATPDQVLLVASPETLILSDDEPSGTFFLSTGSSVQITWQVTDKSDWIEIAPLEGSINREILQVDVTANVAGFQPGTYEGNIKILSNNGGKIEIEVGIAVAAHPLAEVSVNSLEFPVSSSQENFTLFNIGTGFLQWSLSTSDTWLSASPEWGTLSSDDSIVINALVDRSGLPVGDFNGSITIESNSEGGSIELPVNLSVSEAPVLDVSPSAILFDYFVDTMNFIISNSGNTSFNWSAEVSDPFLGLDISSGTVDQGESTSVTITADRTGLFSSTAYPATVTITTDDNQSDTISITVNNFIDEKWGLNHRVIDAEYDRNNDVIVTVAENPSRLYVLDPETKTEQGVNLSLSSNCIAIRPDGAYAAVGHNGFVSYVNLSTMSVEQTYAVTTDALDIILPANGWVYVFPKRDQWERIRCIELSTGIEKDHLGSSIYAGTLAKLHPSDDYIYGADNGLSPSDFEKYDISSGQASYMYDSPYHGDYSFAGNIWISDDGERLFARSRNVFRSSANQSEDMKYAGVLAGEGYVYWLDHSSAANRIYAIFNSSGWYDDSPGSEIRVYEPNFLAFKGTVSLPQFLVPDGEGGGTPYDAMGMFVFVNSAGTRFHVLVQADQSSGLLLDWAVASFDVASTP